MRGVDVRGHAAPHILVAGILQYHLAGGRLAQCGPVLAVLMAAPDIIFLIIDVREQVHGVAVIHPGRIESCPVVVYGHLSVDDLVAAVTVDIGHAQVVVALSGIIAAAGIVAVEYPARFQLLAIPVPCGQHAAGVISAAHHSRCLPAVKTGRGRKETVRAVGIAVAPLAQVSAFGDVVDCSHSLACQAVEHRQVFRPGHNASLDVAPVGLALAYHAPCAIDRAVGGLAYHLGASVAVKVGHQELRVVSSGAYVVAEVDAPQTCAVQTVAVYDDRAGESVVGIVVRVCRVPFQENLILPVAVHVAYRGIVGGIIVLLAERVYPELGLVERNAYISVRRPRREGIYAPVLMPLEGPDLISCLSGAAVRVFVECPVCYRFSV